MTGTINGLSRIGILGGTFNPIHFGHLIMAEQAREFLGLEKVLLIPSGNSYMKDPAQILPAEKRYEMACLAARGNPHFLVSDMEIRRGGDSYTCETLRELRITCAGAKLFYIVGADTLFGIESWKAPEEIFSSCVLAVAARDGCGDVALNQKAKELTQRYNADPDASGVSYRDLFHADPTADPRGTFHSLSGSGTRTPVHRAKRPVPLKGVFHERTGSS